MLAEHRREDFYPYVTVSGYYSGLFLNQGVKASRGITLHFIFVTSCRPGVGRCDLDVISELITLLFLLIIHPHQDS